MKLNQTTFIEIVKQTPLVSIDLLVQNQSGEILLGLRNHHPAKDTWFVPGGRIYKNELIKIALARLTEVELGQPQPLARFRGVFEHLYETNFAQQPGFGTHYVVLAYEILLEEPLNHLPHDQHRQYQWFSPTELLQNPQVHPYTKAYFAGEP